MAEPKTVVVLAGPNGAGKTTSAGGILADLRVTEFVNADIIEREITTSESGSQSFTAGRLMLARIDELHRRYDRGLRNFFTLYRPLVDAWRVYDNSGDVPVLVAQRLVDEHERVFVARTWDMMQRKAAEP